MARGDIDGATKLFADAAELEEAALWAIPPDKVRTVGILGVSATSLWYESTNYKRAIAVAEKLLTSENLDPYYRTQLEDILGAVPYELASTGTGPMAYGGTSHEFIDTGRQRLKSQLVNLLAAARSSDEELSRLYEEFRALLLYVARRKFRVADDAADSLVNEVFLSYMQTSTQIENPRAWLIAAMCNACRHYWRAYGRTEGLVDGFEQVFDPTESLNAHITVTEILSKLPVNCRTLLEQYYAHGLTLLEIAQAEHLTVTAVHARIKRCAGRARTVYAGLIKGKR
jgi:RNA polymerase sigma factor (sigma-70 family)